MFHSLWRKSSPGLRVRRMAGCIVAGIAIAGLASTGLNSTAQADAPVSASKQFSGAAYAANPSNPLAANKWGVITFRNHPNSPWYQWQQNTVTANEPLLRRLAVQPFADTYIPGPHNTGHEITDLINNVQGGDPNTLTQFTLFGIYTVGGGEGSRDALTAREKTAYRRWIRSVSNQVGRSRVAIVMEADLAIIANRTDIVEHHPVVDAAARRGLVAWATKHIHDNNPNSVVYLDAGAAGWLSHPMDAVKLLKSSGIRYARGFALGATHFSFLGDNILYGRGLVRRLAAHGVPRKHVVIDTADNGRPYVRPQWDTVHPRHDWENGWPCTSNRQRVCWALGAPPTWKVGNRSLNRLPERYQPVAKRYVDAYLWFGRPWVRFVEPSDPPGTNAAFQMNKAIGASKYSPYYGDLNPMDYRLTRPVIKTAKNPVNVRVNRTIRVPVTISGGNGRYTGVHVTRFGDKASATLSGRGGNRVLRVKGLKLGITKFQVKAKSVGWKASPPLMVTVRITRRVP